MPNWSFSHHKIRTYNREYFATLNKNGYTRYHLKSLSINNKVQFHTYKQSKSTAGELPPLFVSVYRTIQLSMPMQHVIPFS